MRWHIFNHVKMQTGNWRTSFRGFALGAIPKWHQNIYSTLDLSALLWVYVSLHPEKMLAALQFLLTECQAPVSLAPVVASLDSRFIFAVWTSNSKNRRPRSNTETRLEWRFQGVSHAMSISVASFIANVMSHESGFILLSPKNVHFQLFSVQFSAGDPLIPAEAATYVHVGPFSEGNMLLPCHVYRFPGSNNRIRCVKAWQQIMCIEFDFQWILWFSYLAEKADSGTIATAVFKSWYAKMDGATHRNASHLQFENRSLWGRIIDGHFHF